MNINFCGLGKKVINRGRWTPRAPSSSSLDWVDINGVKVSMEKGDITLGKGDAVVAGEDRELTAKGAVMKALCSAGGKKYRKQRKKLRKRLEAEAGVAGRQQRVYTTKGGKLRYTYVLHAIMPHFRPGKDWYGIMKQLYTDIIGEAEENCIRVMRMPVLGSGMASGPVDVSVKALLDAVTGYSPFEHLHDLILMDMDDNHVRCIQMEMKCRRDGSPKYNTPSPEEKRDPRMRRSRSVDSPRRSNSHSSSNSHLVQVNHAGGAAWNGDDKSWREEPRHRGGNSSSTRGANSREPAHEADWGFGFAPSHQAEELSAFGRQDEVQGGKKKGNTIPRERKPRSQRVFDHEDGPPFHPQDFRHPNNSHAQPASSPLAGDTSRPLPREERPPPFEERRPPPACSSREPQPLFDQRPQGRTPREPYPPNTYGDLKPPPRTHRPSPKLSIRQPAPPLAVPPVNSHSTVVLQSPQAQVLQTRTAVMEKAAGPQGKMVHEVKPSVLPGHPNCGTVVIEYSFANGVQGPTDPRPGQPYKGIFKRAYLPDSVRGRELVRLLREAFDRGLLFQIRSDRRGGEDMVTLRDIPHKTSVNGGPERDAYPDPDYLDRLERALEREGVARDARL